MSDERDSEGWGGMAIGGWIGALIFLVAFIAQTCAQREACRWTLDRYAKTPAETLAVLAGFPAECPDVKSLNK